jgi:hypothetical protein
MLRYGMDLIGVVYIEMGGFSTWQQTLAIHGERKCLNQPSKDQLLKEIMYHVI